jgi:hypothetical protein
MKKNFSSAILALACWLSINPVTPAQSAKPVVFTTVSKIMTARLSAGERSEADLPGRAAFTLTSANDDDTITGILVYTFSDEGRAKFAELTGQELNSVPPYIFKKDVVATFRKGTACPIAHLIVPPTEIVLEEAAIRLERVFLEINEAHGQMPQLLCAWARQVNKKSPRHGIIAAINRLIRGEE